MINSNDKIEIMKSNIGKQISIKSNNCESFGIIVGVYEDDKYMVSFEGVSQSMIIKESMINFVNEAK
jgi:hypothetical protein